MKEISCGLKKACALQGKKGKPVYNPLNDLKVTRKTTFKSFSESFYNYTVKTCRSLVRGFYFRAPVLPDSNVLHISRKKPPCFLQASSSDMSIVIFVNTKPPWFYFL